MRFISYHFQHSCIDYANICQLHWFNRHPRKLSLVLKLIVLLDEWVSVSVWEHLKRLVSKVFRLTCRQKYTHTHTNFTNIHTHITHIPMNLTKLYINIWCNSWIRTLTKWQKHTLTDYQFLIIMFTQYVAREPLKLVCYYWSGHN